MSGISLPTYRKHPQTAGRILDGLAFVVTADDNKLHTLNSTASVLWARASGGITVAQGANALVKEFDIDLETAQTDTQECLLSLVERGILVVE